MNESLVYLLIGLCGIIIFALVFFIAKQLRAQKAAKEAIAQQEATLAAEVEANRRYVTESIRLIANAILHDDKITLTEGAMRLKVMIDNFDPNLHQDKDLGVFEEVYAKTQHIPILKDWKALDRKQQRVFEKEMLSVESDYKLRIERAAKLLLAHEMHRVH